MEYAIQCCMNIVEFDKEIIMKINNLLTVQALEILNSCVKATPVIKYETPYNRKVTLAHHRVIVRQRCAKASVSNYDIFSEENETLKVVN